MNHFCTCPVTGCACHPLNHENGCDPCIKSNLEKKRMPTCMFQAVHDDISEVKDYTIEGFVDFYLKNKNSESQ